MADDQQFILRWHHHESTLLSGLPDLLDSDVLTDITLSAGCGHVKAHRLVLATCSSYFLELFQDMPPLQHPIVVLKDIDYDDLYCLISFMYRGHCRVSADKLQNLLTVAKVLRIRGLCDMQVPHLPTATNNIPVYNFSPNIHQLPTTIIPKLDQDNKVPNNNHSTNNCDLNGNIFEVKTPTTVVAQPSKMYRPSQISPTECQICGKQLSNQYNLRVHLETHENGQHACSVCPHVSRSRDALRKHVSYRHPELTETNSPPRKRSRINTPVTTPVV